MRNCPSKHLSGDDVDTVCRKPFTRRLTLEQKVRRQGFGSAAVSLLALTALLGLSIPDAYSQSPSRSAEEITSGLQPAGTPVAIVSGLNVPWSAILVGDEVLVSERDTGKILAFRPGGPVRSLGAVPDVVAGGDGGLLGLALLEREDTFWIYAFVCSGSSNRIVRMAYRDKVLGKPEILVDGLPGGRSHNGGRIAFGPDGMLYATTGETRNARLAQEPNSLAGKILRMTPEGKVPDDNPFPGSLVYSMGHRHPQGLAWDDNGRLWATEFGNDQWDELNLIEPGANYGWPLVEGRGGDPAYRDPIMQWNTQEMGPSGLVYIDGTFFIAGLTGERIWSVTVDQEGRPSVKSFFAGEYGRIRHVLRKHR
jgi:glucose/arabinose dehydrogenase